MKQTLKITNGMQALAKLERDDPALHEVAVKEGTKRAAELQTEEFAG